ncbi:hypothetical protein RHGRI_018341 [Rhododendron griersonianum]|uniref:UBC core domain-containing protein n=1 Tax=Rhododendron griersonianum TaxID=479676 RepID=A0AAV6K112_9ERIC|nr:hypothetical protein RHGRI_018341 [Rhododendron griersonianum]
MANSNLPRRIIKETQRLLSEPAPGISASPSEENMRYFNVMILGPSQSPYEGGVFKLELFLPEEYPMAAPKIRLLSMPSGNNIMQEMQCIGEKLVSMDGCCRHGLLCLCYTIDGILFGFSPKSTILTLIRLVMPADPSLVFGFRSDVLSLTECICLSMQLGRICLDILKDKWSPALQIRTVLLSIQALLSAPNPDDPLSENIAKHWKSNEAEAVETAKEWTRLYASGA